MNYSQWRAKTISTDGERVKSLKGSEKKQRICFLFILWEVNCGGF